MIKKLLETKKQTLAGFACEKVCVGSWYIKNWQVDTSQNQAGQETTAL